MINIKIIYNPSEIDNLNLFNDHMKKIHKEYNDNFILETSDTKKFDLLINDIIVYTLDDNFSIQPVSTTILLKKIEQHIYSAKSLRRRKQDSKFDDIGLIDF